MAHQQHAPKCNRSVAGDDSGGRSSKKLKSGKVPQRGMGVAQLEKILIERQLKDSGALAPDSVKLRRPAVALPPPVQPNFGARSMHGGGNNWSRLYNFNSSNPSIWGQQSCSSSMVNVSLEATSSSTPSSIMNMQLEPPSNQSHFGNKYPSFNPNGEKMVGMKRSYPFSMENIPPISKPDESTLRRRENPSNSGSINDQKTKKFIDENLDLAKDFLTLAPPQPSPPKLQPFFVGELTRPSYQGQTRDASETEVSNQQPLHSFFPIAKSNGISNGEVAEPVDLSLKL